MRYVHHHTAKTHCEKSATERDAAVVVYSKRVFFHLGLEAYPEVKYVCIDAV
jgi:hypothetical protein